MRIEPLGNPDLLERLRHPALRGQLRRVERVRRDVVGIELERSAEMRLGQVVLAVLGLAEVIRRFLSPEGIPDVPTMLVVATLALAGNIATLLVLRGASRGEVHIQASWIFTSNDIKVNGLVILAGVLVWTTGSQVPDLVAGGFIFVVVALSARRILRLARASAAPSA